MRTRSRYLEDEVYRNAITDARQSIDIYGLKKLLGKEPGTVQLSVPVTGR
ncbi:MAG: hypothetical protein J5I50_09025 [Chitinophagaceae bacterium]|nr:hypothetical protein [Chitinophagaceae bacterium]